MTTTPRPPDGDWLGTPYLRFTREVDAPSFLDLNFTWEVDTPSFFPFCFEKHYFEKFSHHLFGNTKQL